jgi:hypothetical protein
MDCFVALLLAMTGKAELIVFTAPIPPDLSHNATAMRSRLKLWNELRTNRARIGDSFHVPFRSPQHLAAA